MELPKEAYQALEDIVGPEYITQEPVIGESYNQVWGNKLVFGGKHTKPPAAILLPANTQEIQAIVKACNKYRIPFKAFCAGFELVATALESEGSIILDLRRMNRILEIDARNMHAVVEPYVSVYKLQMEGAKHGLYTGRPGVGYSANVLALTCCHQEMLNSQVYTSGFGRNVLGVEWVLPTGELLKLGTSGREGGWYSADGPGFSLRGILRGRSGANGGHGVITKASVKMYPWFGPPQWEMVREPGEPLSYAQIEKVPERYKAFIISFPSMENMLKATAEMAHEQITCVLIPGFTETGFNGEGNDEEWALLQKMGPEEVKQAQNSATVIINSHSARELAYREKCLMTITEKYGGYLLPQMNDPKTQARLFMYQMWSTGVPGVRATGDFMVSIQGAEGSQDMMMKLRPVEAEAAEPFVKSGALMQSLSGIMYRPQEHFSVGCSCGIGTNFDPWDPVSLEAAQKYMRDVYDPQGRFRSFGYTSRGAMIQVESINHIHQRWGPIYDHADFWLRQVKKMLDPNNVADALAYIPPEYPEAGSKDE
jgi:glycolate oxidase